MVMRTAQGLCQPSLAESLQHCPPQVQTRRRSWHSFGVTEPPASQRELPPPSPRGTHRSPSPRDTWRAGSPRSTGTRATGSSPWSPLLPSDFPAPRALDAPAAQDPIRRQHLPLLGAPKQTILHSCSSEVLNPQVFPLDSFFQSHPSVPPPHLSGTSLPPLFLQYPLSSRLFCRSTRL